MAEGTVQVNISMEPELAMWIDTTVAAEGEDNRSAFVRKLIRQERARRQQLSLPLPTPTTEAQ